MRPRKTCALSILLLIVSGGGHAQTAPAPRPAVKAGERGVVQEGGWMSHFYKAAYHDPSYKYLDAFCRYNMLLVAGLKNCDIIKVGQEVIVPQWEDLLLFAGELPAGGWSNGQVVVSNLPATLQVAALSLAQKRAAAEGREHAGNSDLLWAAGIVRIFVGAGVSEAVTLEVASMETLDVDDLMKSVLKPLKPAVIYYTSDGRTITKEGPR